MRFISAAQLWNMKLLHFWSPEKLGRVWTEPYLPRCRLSVRSSGFLSVAHECLSETCWLAQGDGIRFYAMLLWHHRSQFKKMTCPDLCFIFARRRPQSSSTIFFSSYYFSAIWDNIFYSLHQRHWLFWRTNCAFCVLRLQVVRLLIFRRLFWYLVWFQNKSG